MFWVLNIHKGEMFLKNLLLQLPGSLWILITPTFSAGIRDPPKSGKHARIRSFVRSLFGSEYKCWIDVKWNEINVVSNGFIFPFAFSLLTYIIIRVDGNGDV